MATVVTTTFTRWKRRTSTKIEQHPTPHREQTFLLGYDHHRIRSPHPDRSPTLAQTPPRPGAGASIGERRAPHGGTMDPTPQQGGNTPTIAVLDAAGRPQVYVEPRGSSTITVRPTSPGYHFEVADNRTGEIIAVGGRDAFVEALAEARRWS